MKIKSTIKNRYSFLFVLTIILIQLGCNISNKPNKQNIALVKKDAVLNIDPVKILPDKFQILLENKHVRVVQYSLKPGEKDDWHTHPAKSSYVLSGGKLKVYLENGEIIFADEETGTASWIDYVGKHYVENIGNTEVTIVYTEIK